MDKNINGIIVTDVSFRPFTKGKLIGFCDLTFNECFTIKSLSVFGGEDGLGFSFPAKPDKEGKWRADNFASAELKEYILDKIKSVVGEDQKEAKPPATAAPKSSKSPAYGGRTPDDLPF